MLLAGESVRSVTRQHGIVLARPLARALGLTAGGVALLSLGWPFSTGGALLLVLSAVVAVRAVWRWERTRIVVTSERLLVVEGTLRRKSRAVVLDRVGPVEVDESLVGRLLGYGTLIAGELEVSRVPRPRDLCRVLAQARPRELVRRVTRV